MSEPLVALQLDPARTAFEHVLCVESPVRLFSEDADPVSGLVLGNLAQADTHVGLTHAAMTLGAVIDARDVPSRPWG